MTKDQLTAIVQYTIDIEQLQGGVNIESDKHLTFQVLQLTTCFKIEFTWIVESETVGPLDDRETKLTTTDTYFRLLPNDSNAKLYESIIECLTEIEKTTLIIN